MNRIIILILVLAVLLLSACASVELIDHTPEEFPATDYPPVELSPAVYQELVQLGGSDEHRFRVEVKSRNVDVRTIQTLVWVDSAWHNMSGEGQGIWYYDSPDKCNNEYRYTFRVFYEGGNKAIEQQPSNLSTVAVSDFGNVSWYWKSPSGVKVGPVQTGDGEVRFRPAPFNESTIVIQNLRTDPIRVIDLWFFDDGTEVGLENWKFELLDLPTLPVDLACGETLEIRVRWNPEGSDESDNAQVLIQTTKSPGWSAGFRGIITLRGRPGPT